MRNVVERMEMNMIKAEMGRFCNGCVLDNPHRKPFILRSDRSQVVGELIQGSDVNGPMSAKSLQGTKYCLCLNDDYSKYHNIFFIKQKS